MYKPELGELLNEKAGEVSDPLAAMNLVELTSPAKVEVFVPYTTNLSPTLNVEVTVEEEPTKPPYN
jgi:hypothetical protein